MKHFVFVLLTVLFLGIGLVPVKADAVPAKEKSPVIRDYRKYLNRQFKKEKRLSTQFIIIHTSEAGLGSTLRTLSRGKKMRSNHRTVGGHAHYTVARNGIVYRVLDHRYRADHAGLSMWNGVEDISSHSLAIELVGYHYGEITAAQYRSLEQLVKTLQRIYSIPGKNVLTHSQVSYGKPNRWYSRPHRGRKRCGLNFDRSRIGLGNDVWTYDPDVRAGRLIQDHHIYAMFYKPFKYRKTKPLPAKPEPTAALSNVISKYNTAWNIAGEDCSSPDTLYRLPDGREIRGDRIAKVIGWNRIPKGTEVLLNQPAGFEKEKKKGPIFEITRDLTAWSYAGKAYNAPSTFYFFSNGGFVAGTRVFDWDSLPEGTRMIIGYQPPALIRNIKGKTPWGIAGRAYNQRETLYYLPGNRLLTGDQIEDFNDLPRGTLIFLSPNAGSRDPAANSSRE